MLRREGVDPVVRKKLELVQEIVAFGQSEIGLQPSENYTTYCDVGAGPACWALVVCPKDRLDPVQWRYPVVGLAPYRGYFDLQLAERDRNKLASQGFDTYLRPVSAYSTLGWFSDPILSSMLRLRDEDLANLLIHELTHATVWIPSDVPFNEGLATFVGEAGSLLFLEAKHGPDFPSAREVLARRADRRPFLTFMAGLIGELEALYASDRESHEKVSEREKIFAEAKSRFSDLPFQTDSYSGFLEWQLNNARLASFRTYTSKLDLFERVYEAAGRNLKDAVTVFRSCADLDDPREYLEMWIHGRTGSLGSE